MTSSLLPIQARLTFWAIEKFCLPGLMTHNGHKNFIRTTIAIVWNEAGDQECDRHQRLFTEGQAKPVWGKNQHYQNWSKLKSELVKTDFRTGQQWRPMDKMLYLLCMDIDRWRWRHKILRTNTGPTLATFWGPWSSQMGSLVQCASGTFLSL